MLIYGKLTLKPTTILCSLIPGLAFSFEKPGHEIQRPDNDSWDHICVDHGETRRCICPFENLYSLLKEEDSFYLDSIWAPITDSLVTWKSICSCKSQMSRAPTPKEMKEDALFHPHMVCMKNRSFLFWRFQTKSRNNLTSANTKADFCILFYFYLPPWNLLLI